MYSKLFNNETVILSVQIGDIHSMVRKAILIEDSVSQYWKDGRTPSHFISSFDSFVCHMHDVLLMR